MNTIGMALVWCVVQVTLLAVVAALVYGVVRRYGPPARALAALAGLLLIAGLTALAFSPWPHWRMFSEQSAIAATNSSGTRSVADAHGDGNNTAAQPGDGNSEITRLKASRITDALSPTAEFFKALVANLEPQPVAKSTAWEWPAYVALLFLLGAGAGLMRLVAGWAAVRSYRNRARPITDASLLETLDVLLAELRGPSKVVICESESLATPATIGWRQPLIILPADWRSWSSDECRTVLAHEIAHIARHDFATWVAAQLALVFHVYHPLVHWLAARLRLEQELAADAAAAQVTGGQRAYLTTLAGMALHQSNRPLAWPARTFLPTRGTFMRRIEMLRDEKLTSTKVTAGFRWGMIGALAVAGLAIAGLRGTAADSGPDNDRNTARVASGSTAALAAADDAKPKPSQASATTGASSASGTAGTSSTTSGSGSTSSSTTGTSDPLSLAWVPRDAIGVVRIRPAKLLNRPALAALKKLPQQKELLALLGIAPDRIEQVTIFALINAAQPGRLGGEPEPSGFIVRLSDAADAPTLLKSLQPQPEQQEFAGVNYVRGREGRGPFCFQADERTVAISGREDFVRRMIVAGKTGASRAKWADVWRSAENADMAAIVNTAALREMMKQAAANAGSHQGSIISPLWEEASTALLTVDYREQLTASLAFAGEGSQAPQRIRDTLAAVVTLSQNALSQSRSQFSQFPGDDAAIKLRAADMFDALLDSVKITTTETQVRATASLDADEAAAIATMLVPAVGKAREAAQRAQSVNNMKQIGLAMHNYHEANKSFPPAILYGPDGKTPYSWRVALLPHLGQPALYEQYKKDEPWDSAANRRVLAQMPAVFRDPSDPENSTSASYFALTGPSTMFPGKEGTTFPQVTDGLSNTILFIEARRDIPWTKPEDLPYDKDKPIPAMGGHYEGIFIASMADGAVRMFAKNIAEAKLRAMITRDGGELVEF